MRVVIVGNGMAGARLATELSDQDVLVLGAEEHPAYNRILLSSVLAGKHRPGDIALVGSPKARTGVTVTAIDRVEKTVTTSDGSIETYDHLVLATGSRAIVPRGMEGALTFRTLDDCHNILAQAQNASTAIVLGGGLLGLEAARGLAGRGITVEVVHAVGHLMERQLDPGASRVLERTLGELGIKVHLNAMATSISDERNLHLDDGRVLTADLIVVACGVRPETELAVKAGLKVDRGIVVDERLRTSDRFISAIGDCAQLGNEVGGLVAPAWEQARVVAQQLTSDPLAVYQPQPPITRLKASGIDLAAMGTLQGDDEVLFADPARGTYARVLISGDRVTGAVMLGDNPAVGQVIQIFDRKLPLPLDRRTLLLGRGGGSASAVDSPALMPDAATVCQCNGVSKGALVKCFRDGDDVVTRTRATTGCGSCKDAVEGIIRWLEVAA
ncbi:FAD-dependent oxidoreductase [Allorhizocola rhizosphaerae]|uniref:FAD-dependent oxidoreductase n=1 Tax=Allorhizocola rhizosphaerae TaxID=1872709 RepID=UPI000E3B8865|nr:FAD-dependent oxidoreductase [Allorhizocola rhizosphaerae]